MICPNCDRVDMFSVSREKTVYEYRNVYSDNKKEHKSADNHHKYKGPWKLEETVVSDEMTLRCSACETDVDIKKVKGIGEIKIDKAKGVVFVNDFFDQFNVSGKTEKQRKGDRRIKKERREDNESQDK